MSIIDLLKPSKTDPGSLEARFVAGDMAAMEEIMGVYERGIYQIGLRLFQRTDQAADFCHDVFIRIYEKRKKFDPSKPLKPWLFKVAINLGRDRLREHKEIQLEEKHIQEQIFMPQMESNLITEENKARVRAAMENVKPGYKEILALRFSSDMKLKEIAGILGITLSSAKTRLCRGLKAFEEAYRQAGGEEYVL